MRTLIVAALIGVAVTSTGSIASHAQSAAVGTWAGHAFQDSSAGRDWPLRLSILDNGNATIEYPTLKCGGVLIRQSARGAEYREQIDYGRDKCADNGRVVIQP